MRAKLIAAISKLNAKEYLFIFFLLSGIINIPLLTAQSAPDSLFLKWKNEYLSDTIRIEAYMDYLSKSEFELVPDTLFELAQQLYNFAEHKGLEGYMARALEDQAYAIYLKQGKVDSLSMNYWSRSLAIYKKTSDDFGIAYVHRLIGYCYWAANVDYEKALMHFEVARKVFEEINDKKYLAQTLLNIGLVYSDQGVHEEAIEYFLESTAYRLELEQTESLTWNYINLSDAYMDQGNDSKALHYLLLAAEINERNNDPVSKAWAFQLRARFFELQGKWEEALEFLLLEEQVLDTTMHLYENNNHPEYVIQNYNSIGNTYGEIGKYHLALNYHKKSLAISESINWNRYISQSLISLGKTYKNLADNEKAFQHFQRANIFCKKNNFKEGIVQALINLGEISLSRQAYTEASTYCENAYHLLDQMEMIPEKKRTCYCLFNANKELLRLTKALSYLEEYTQYRDSLQSTENQKAHIRTRYKYEYQQEAIGDSIEFAKRETIQQLELDKQEANLAIQRIALSAIGGGLLLIALLAFSFYRGKRKSDELLLNILPKETAKELKEKGYAEPKRINKATVFFSDFKGFTSIAEQMSPEDLVAEIHECFSRFDEIMQKHQIEKIKTIGDAYMAASGLSSTNSEQVKNMILAALEVQAYMKDLKQRRIDQGLRYFETRVGIHTGPVVAGVVGVKKFQYDIWGDTVNTASRMESNGEAGQVNISEQVYLLIKDTPAFKFTYRGMLTAKGKGEMKMYFVENANHDSSD